MYCCRLLRSVSICLMTSWLVGFSTVPTVQAESLYLAFWNVENLFDTEDDPRVEGDEEFTPAARKGWTAERLQTKLDNLDRVIRQMNEGRGPDVLGLAEVENRGVVERLVRELRPLGRDYRIIHKDSPSGRGIDCAVIYDASRLELARSDFVKVHAGATRDIVYADFRVRDQHLHFFVNHWPSRRSPAEARITAARTLRTQVDRLLQNQPQADIVIMGDLNDMPNNESVTRHLRTWGTASQLRPGQLFNSTWALHVDRQRGSYVYQNQWQQLDHVILSPGMLDQRNFRWREGSTDVVQYTYMMFQPRGNGALARPSRSYSGDTFHRDGYSDHLPVRCIVDY